MSLCIYFVSENSIPDYTRNQLTSDPYLYSVDYLRRMSKPLKLTEQDTISYCEMRKRECTYTSTYTETCERSLASQWSFSCCVNINFILKCPNQTFIIIIYASSNYCHILRSTISM